MKLNFKRFGENGGNLIILHGLFGMLDNWSSLSKQFAEQHTVFAVDQRNHGKSGHSAEAGYDAMAKDLAEFMNEQGLYTANIIGHSMGGKTAMKFTALYPERVERLVVVDIAPKRYNPKHSTIIEALQYLPINKISSRNEADEWLEQRIPEFGVRQFLLKNLKRTTEGFEWKMNLEALVNNYDEIIGEVETGGQFDRPVLAIRGALSDYINHDDIENFESSYSNFRIATINGSGHLVHADNAPEFYNVVDEFLKEPLY